MITSSIPFIKNEPLVPVRDAQRNLSKQFKQGLVRITKNGKSLGYLISDKVMRELMEEMEEDIAASNPKFIAKMKDRAKSENTIPLEEVLKEYNL